MGKRSEPNIFKIGLTRAADVERRLRALQTGNSDELYVYTTYKTNAPYKLEKMLHNHYRLCNIQNEWFKFSTGEELNFISICDMYQKNIDALASNPFFELI